MDVIELRTAHTADPRRRREGCRPPPAARRAGAARRVRRGRRGPRGQAPPETQRGDHGGPGTGGAVGVPACCARRERRGQLPVRSAGMAAVAGTLHRPDPGLDPAHPDKDGIICVLPVSVPA